MAKRAKKSTSVCVGDSVTDSVTKRKGYVVAVRGKGAVCRWLDDKTPATTYIPISDLAKKNPAPLATAKAEYESKHWGIPAKRAKQVTAPIPKGALVEMGTLKGVMYETDKKGDGPSVYVHEFEGKRPKLAFDTRSDKKRLFIVGGTYDVKDRGIVG